MTTMQCNTCGGVYDTVLLDGSRYFHVCHYAMKPPDRRDENVPSTDTQAVGAIKLPGKGATVKP